MRRILSRISSRELARGVVIFLLGTGSGLWWLHTPPPWIEFQDIAANYERGSHAILITGHYIVNRECNHGSRPVIWRTEALATDGQIAVYGPKPGLPDLSVGLHDYDEPLPLLETILPDGWRVTILTTCTSAIPETVVSPSALVTMQP